MSVLIITLNYNQVQYTLNCVESLLNSEYKEFKVLVVDNGSEKNNYDKLKAQLPNDERIILHRIEVNRGYVGGINYGLEKGLLYNLNYFLIMNNDVVIEKSAITELVKTCKGYNDKAIVTGKIYLFDKPDTFQYVGSKYINRRKLEFKKIGKFEKDEGQHDTEQERDMLDDVYWLFSKNLYEEIGGYSEYFWFNGEQADYALRAVNNDYKLVYTPKAKLWHKCSATMGGRDYNPVLVFWVVQSQLVFKYIHMSFINFLPYYFKTWGSFFRTFFKSFYLLFKGINRFRYSYAKLKGILYFNHWVIFKTKNDGRNPFIRTKVK
jgi:GT2 family glycosyltransferase